MSSIISATAESKWNQTFTASIYSRVSDPSLFLNHVLFHARFPSARALTDVVHRIAQLIQDEECVSDTA